MKKLQFKIKHKGNEYPIDAIDFVNERIAFRLIDEDMKTIPAHVDMNKHDILIK